MTTGEETRFGRVTFVIIVFLASLLSVFLYPLSGLLGLVGLLFGCFILIKGRSASAVFPIGEAKWLTAGSFIVLLLFSMIAAPDVLTSQSALNESSAVASIRLIREGEKKFLETAGRYATLKELSDSGLVNPEFASEVSAGYRLSVRLKQNGFETFATPVRYGSVLGTGKRSFYGDESGRLREGNKGGREASSEDEPVD